MTDASLGGLLFTLLTIALAFRFASTVFRSVSNLKVSTWPPTLRAFLLMDTAGRGANQPSSNARGSARTRTRSRSEASSTTNWDVDSILPSEVTSTAGAGRLSRDPDEQLRLRARRIDNPRRTLREERREVRNNNVVAEPSAVAAEAGSQAINLRRAIEASMTAFRTTGLNVTITTGGTERTEFIRLPPATDDENTGDIDNASTTLGRRVLASAAAGRSAAQARAQERLELTARLRARRMSFDRQYDRSNLEDTAGDNTTIQPSDVEREPPSFVRPSRRLRRNAENVFPVSASDDEIDAVGAIPPVRPIRRSSVTPPPRVGEVYTRVVDPQSSSASYNVTRLLNADGDEYVHRIPAEGLINPNPPDSYEAWMRNYDQERRAREAMASLGRINREGARLFTNNPPVNEQRQAQDATFPSFNTRREIPAPLGARPAPPPRQNVVGRRRRARQYEDDLPPINNATLQGYADAMRRETEELEAQFENAMHSLGRLEFLSPSARLRLLQAGVGGRDDQPVNTPEADNLPPGLREQLAGGTPYYLYPLPQPLDHNLPSMNGGRRTAVPATSLSEFAAR